MILYISSFMNIWTYFLHWNKLGLCHMSSHCCSHSSGHRCPDMVWCAERNNISYRAEKLNSKKDNNKKLRALLQFLMLLKFLITL